MLLGSINPDISLNSVLLWIHLETAKPKKPVHHLKKFSILFGWQEKSLCLISQEHHIENLPKFFARGEGGRSQKISITIMWQFIEADSTFTGIYPPSPVIVGVTLARVSFVFVIIMRIRTDEIILIIILTRTVNMNSLTALRHLITCSTIAKETFFADTIITLIRDPRILHRKELGLKLGGHKLCPYLKWGIKPMSVAAQVW